MIACRIRTSWKNILPFAFFVVERSTKSDHWNCSARCSTPFSLLRDSEQIKCNDDLKVLKQHERGGFIFLRDLPQISPSHATTAVLCPCCAHSSFPCLYDSCQTMNTRKKFALIERGYLGKVIGLLTCSLRLRKWRASLWSPGRSGTLW